MLKIIKLAFILAVFCVLSAFGLAYVYLFTQPKIEANAKAALENSLKEVLPGADSFIEKDEVFIGLSKSKKVGVVFKKAPRGYSSEIEMLVGVDNNGKVSGLKILSQRETPGLGANVTGVKFLRQFLGKSKSDPIEPKRDIDAITGATISSRAVCRGVKSAIRDKEIK